VSDRAVRRILVIRRHNHLGDMLCSMPLYAALRKRWPDASLTLLATPTRYAIPLQEINPCLDQVEYYRKGTLQEVIRAHRSLRTRDFDMAIVPSTIAISRTSHITALLTGARMRVGVRSIDGNRNAYHPFLNMKADVFWGGEHVHQEERNRQIARIAGCDISAEEMRAFRIPHHPSADAAAGEALGEWGDGRRLIGVHPGAGKEQNVWAGERFAEVLSELYHDGAGEVVITCGALDEEQAGVLAGLLDRKGVPHRILRDLPFGTLAAVFRRLGLYLTNDTGTMHVAAYSGCATVSLFGPTPSWEWGPRGEHHRTVQSDDGTMEGIPVESVLRACQSLLEA